MTDLEGIMTSCYLAGHVIEDDRICKFRVPKPEQFTLTFGAVGKLTVSENGKLEFIGDAEESAKIFFEFLQMNINFKLQP